MANVPDWAESISPQRNWTSSLAVACQAAREYTGILEVILTRSGFHYISSNGRSQLCLDPKCTDITSCRKYRSAPNFCRFKLKVYKAAVTPGQLHVLSWLFHEVHPCSWAPSKEECPLLGWLLSAAAASGQLYIVAWLRQEVPSRLWKGLLLPVCKAAAQAGQLSALQWLTAC